MNDSDMDSQTEHPDELLAWYVNGTLDSGERQSVEAHLAQCERCQQEVTWLQSVRTQIKDETISGPGDLGLQRLLREVRVQKSTTRQWWRPALAAAMVIIVVQFVMILHLQKSPDTMIPLGGPTASGVVVQVKFAPNASEAQIRRLLQKVHADLIAGPGALGIYRLRLDGVTAEQAQVIRRRIAELKAQQAIVTYAERE